MAKAFKMTKTEYIILEVNSIINMDPICKELSESLEKRSINFSVKLIPGNYDLYYIVV